MVNSFEHKKRGSLIGASAIYVFQKYSNHVRKLMPHMNAPGATIKPVIIVKVNLCKKRGKVRTGICPTGRNCIHLF